MYPPLNTNIVPNQADHAALHNEERYRINVATQVQDFRGDLNTLIQPGYYFVEQGPSSNHPALGNGYLTIPPAGNQDWLVVQEFHGIDTGQLGYRRRVAGEWSAWQVHDQNRAGYRPPSAQLQGWDYNELRTPGKFFCFHASPNGPGMNAVVDVDVIGDGGTVIQRAAFIDRAAVAVRHFGGGTWTPWKVSPMHTDWRGLDLVNGWTPGDPLPPLTIKRAGPVVSVNIRDINGTDASLNVFAHVPEGYRPVGLVNAMVDSSMGQIPAQLHPFEHTLRLANQEYRPKNVWGTFTYMTEDPMPTIY